jgi:hypothetical protein
MENCNFGEKEEKHVSTLTEYNNTHDFPTRPTPL